MGIRYGTGSHRGGYTPAERRSLDGQVSGWIHHRPTRNNRYAHPHCLRLGFSSQAQGELEASGTHPARGVKLSACGKEEVSALSLAYEALREGGTMPAVLNAANEVAVAAFLGKQIGFRQIHRLIDKTMQDHTSRRIKDVDEILEVDRWARAKASSL